MAPTTAREKWLVDAGNVLAAWFLLLMVENFAVGVGYRALFAGSWEMAAARSRVSPIALALLAPLALVAPLVARLVMRTETEARARKGVALAAAILGGIEAYGVSFGRHMSSWGVRAPFIAFVAAIASGVAWVLAPRLATLARVSPRALAGGAVAVAALAWLADAFVLPRLYGAFHAALAITTLASAALLSFAWRGARLERMLAWATLTLGVGCASWAPLAAERLHTADNLRLVLLEHAPVLGRAVRFASWVSPPPEEEAGPEPTGGPAEGNGTRALDWTGRDVLVISIDALRADHVGAYGYARPTTPNLDRLAREGAVFEAAYCPTPHTSYSITSMMTGKYMRPLLAIGVGNDSETWASYARRYGYRTGAFYPPAVFFIDEGKFGSYRDRGLDFEYRKVEFASPALRVAQVTEYVTSAPPDRPLFVWVHLFEPHEPYVMHPEHRFGPREGWTDVDAYDSEIAAADAGLGAIVDVFRSKRAGSMVIVTADHGEEFGEHGGRYHGTTVYEEQVHVPLVVSGPGVVPHRIATPVQTIDLLATMLSAVGVPRPARIRGRDLGPLLAGKEVSDQGHAFAETDEYTLLARASNRLVCARKAGACALYDVKEDPRETRDVSNARPNVARDLRKATHALAREVGRYEAGEGANLPEALRRGLQGDVEAADDVAALLDDAKTTVRRRAAEVLFQLHSASTGPQLWRALQRDEDSQVKRFAALALVRIGERAAPLAEAMVTGASLEWRRRAALAFAEQGDARGEKELVAWWAEEGPPAQELGFEAARELLAAMVKVKAAGAAATLTRSLADIRLRPDIADALGELGDARAKAPLLAAFASERYVSARPHEARALLRLGARSELEAPLARFAGLPQPMRDVLSFARDAGLLVPGRGGWSTAAPTRTMTVELAVPKGPRRLLVLTSSETSAVTGTLGGESLRFTHDGTLRIADVALHGGTAALKLADEAGVLAAWVVAPAEEIPPPAPERWDSGPD